MILIGALLGILSVSPASAIASVDACLSSPCLNGGSCETQQTGGYICRCPSSRYIGMHCEVIIDGDRDPCSSFPCANQGQCEPFSLNKFECYCKPRYTGRLCETYQDSCQAAGCINAASCLENNPSGPLCICMQGFFGPKCQFERDPCLDLTCRNGGSCLVNNKGAWCVCRAPFIGPQCQYIDPTAPSACASGPCLNRGICTDDGTGYHCKCLDQHTGQNCQYRFEIDVFASPEFKQANCGQSRTAQKGYYHLKTKKTDTSQDLCRAVGPVYSEAGPYSFSLTIQTNRSTPGILYNAQDENNFDFAYFPSNRPLDDSRQCAVFGRLEQGKVTGLAIEMCGTARPKFPNNANIEITASVNATGVNFRLESPNRKYYVNYRHETKLRPSGRFGVLGLNDVEGDVKHWGHNISAEPSLTRLEPSLGPMAGGTRVTIHGKNLPKYGLSRIPTVIIGNRCTLLFHNVSQIVALTPAISTSLTPVSIQVFYGNFRLVLKTGFTFKPDPMVTSFEPHISILDGGVTITARGEHLKSASDHYLVISVLHTRAGNRGAVGLVSEQDFRSECHVKSDQEMTCRTPRVSVPAAFLVVRGPRRRREAGNQTLISDHSVQGEKLSFYASFEMDGVTSLEGNTEQTRVEVYANPYFDVFDPILQMFNPDSRSPSIKITGDYFLHGPKPSDYSVRVGVAECTHLQVTDNLLTCLPPRAEPDEDTALTLKARPGEPSVMVMLNRAYHVGHLDWLKSSSAAQGLHVRGAAGVVGAVLLFVWWVVRV